MKDGSTTGAAAERARVVSDQVTNVVSRFESSVEIMIDALRAVQLEDLDAVVAAELHNRLEAAAGQVELLIRALGEPAGDAG